VCANSGGQEREVHPSEGGRTQRNERLGKGVQHDHERNHSGIVQPYASIGKYPRSADFAGLIAECFNRSGDTLAGGAQHGGRLRGG
jgi:hypothetical protein